MEEKKSIYKKIEAFLEKSKIPTAYVLFIYVTSLQYMPSTWDSEEFLRFKEISLYSAAIALGLIILRVFFDVYKKINEPNEPLPFFNTWSEVMNSTEFSKLFKKRLEDDKVIHLKLIGISLRYHWPYIKNLMEEYLIQNKNVEFNLTLAMLDTDSYDNLEFIDDNFKSKFLLHAQASKNDIYLFKKIYEGKEKGYKCNVELLEYTFMPSFYGISLDNKFLFLGNTYWGKDMIRSAGQSYNLFVEDDDFSGSERINIFNSWFEYIRKQAVNREKDTSKIAG